MRAGRFIYDVYVHVPVPVIGGVGSGRLSDFRAASYNLATFLIVPRVVGCFYVMISTPRYHDMDRWANGRTASLRGGTSFFLVRKNGSQNRTKIRLRGAKNVSGCGNGHTVSLVSDFSGFSRFLWFL